MEIFEICIVDYPKIDDTQAFACKFNSGYENLKAEISKRFPNVIRMNLKCYYKGTHWINFICSLQGNILYEFISFFLDEDGDKIALITEDDWQIFNERKIKTVFVQVKRGRSDTYEY